MKIASAITSQKLGMLNICRNSKAIVRTISPKKQSPQPAQERPAQARNDVWSGGVPGFGM
jgi:hypothetical protein